MIIYSTNTTLVADGGICGSLEALKQTKEAKLKAICLTDIYLMSKKDKSIQEMRLYIKV